MNDLMKRARLVSCIITAVQPLMIIFLLSPFAYFAGLFTKTELFSLITDIRISVIASATSITGFILQSRTWKHNVKRIKNQKDKELIFKILSKLSKYVFLNYLTTMVLFFLFTALTFTFLLPLSVPNWPLYIFSFMIAFYLLSGSILFSIIIETSEQYYSTFKLGNKKVYPLKMKLMALVSMNAIGTIAMFFCIDLVVEVAKSIGRTLPMERFSLNLITGSVAIFFLIFIILRFSKIIKEPSKSYFLKR